MADRATGRDGPGPTDAPNIEVFMTHRVIWRAAGFTLAVALFVVALLTLPALAHGRQCGIASWYGPGFYGNLTANGERYTGKSMTAAHKSLPFGTQVRVTDQATGRTIVVRINDRGPFIAGRVIDLSSAAADRFGLKGRGVARVCLDVLK
jgi:peptidoglycan lytic transglycosylase